MTHNLITRIVNKYDGQGIYINNNQLIYEIGHYLGGGVSGSVYSGISYNIQLNERNIAIKILNPIGYKLFPINQINKCEILKKGLNLNLEQIQGKSNLISDNVWWLYHTSTRQILAAYEV